MNKKILLIFMSCSMSCSTAKLACQPITHDATQEVMALSQAITRPQLTQNQEEITVVVANFANIVGNFFNIMNNKENPEEIGGSLSSIFNSLVDIAVQASKTSGQEITFDETIQNAVTLLKKYFANLNTQDIAKLKRAITKAAQLHLEGSV